MPDHLEFVVRPSQAPNIRPGVPTQIFQSPKPIDNEPKVWGNAGQSVFDLHAHSQAEVKPPEFPETKRTYDVVRVYNPDDNSQYIDTEEMTEYQGRNQISADRITLRFAKTQNTENVKVQQRGLTRKNPDNPDPDDP
jgi:hypothetical protein